MKRSASSSAIDPSTIKRHCLPLTPGYCSVNIPSKRYVLIYVDDKGNLRVEKSDSTQEEASILFTPQARQNLLEILGGRIDHHPATDCSRDACDDSLGGVGSDSDGGMDIDKWTPIHVADTQEVIKYYESALDRFQQLNCCKVAKAFIKFIEPRKQAKYPYNGKKPRSSSEHGAICDPEKTKPNWWPSDVIHREPDHLLKEDRIKLLVHIICNVRDERITTDGLREVVGETKSSLKPRSHVGIIYEILHVRKTQESYQNDKAAENPAVYVKYGGTNSGAEKSMATSNPAQAINKNVPIILTSMHEQSVTAISTEHAYPVQDCYPLLGVQPGYIPREVPDSTLSLSLQGPVHTTPVQYSAWEMPILHRSAQISTRFSAVGALQGSSVPSINNIYSGFSADTVMGRQPFSQVPPFHTN